jgi:hypothetical protein
VQIDGKRDGLSDARPYADHAAIATPVTSAQVAKAWVRSDRRVCGGVVVSAAGENVGDLVMGGPERQQQDHHQRRSSHEGWGRFACRLVIARYFVPKVLVVGGIGVAPNGVLVHRLLLSPLDLAFD